MNRYRFATKPLIALAGAATLGLGLAAHPRPAGLGGPYGDRDIQIPFTDAPSRAMRPDGFMPRPSGGADGMNWQRPGEKAMEP